MKIGSYTLLALLLALSQACYYDNKEDLYQNFPDEECDTQAVTYSGEVQVLLANNCAVSGCHAGPNAIGGLDLTRYNDAKSIADNGDLVGRITATRGALMPPTGTGALAACEIEKIKAWVEAGATND